MMPEQTTLQVTNLPADVTDRELYLLFGSIPGFEKSWVVRQDGVSPKIGLVKFRTRQDANVAKTKIDKFCFIPRKSDDFTSSGIKPEADMASKVSVEWTSSTPQDWASWANMANANIISAANQLPSSVVQPQAQMQSLQNQQFQQQPVAAAEVTTLLVQGIPDTVGQDLFEAFIQANFATQYTTINCAQNQSGRGLAYAVVNFTTSQFAKGAAERMDGYQWNHQGSASALQASVTELATEQPAAQQPVVVSNMPMNAGSMGLLGDNVQQAFGGLGVGGNMFANQPQGAANGSNAGLIGGLNNTMPAVGGMNMGALGAAGGAGFPMGIQGYQIPVAFGNNAMFQQQQPGIQQSQQQQPQQQNQQQMPTQQHQLSAFGMPNMQNMQQMQNMFFQQQMQQQPQLQSLQAQAGMFTRS